ncbi:hypothetical protein Sya03_58270 [Spirilliplanes yamanashiensis]|uniref:Uncharacterized protein n=1 Tax=Spirilliplanes yamanashiensis TaxID=42233 RepID=A0A8J3YEY3_9ACTN|nr:hypothetical protein Sya03_58270 [Spirilliplanes yamanashiensis]
MYEERVRFTPTVVLAIGFFLVVAVVWAALFGTDPAMRGDAEGWAVILVPVAVFGGVGVAILADVLRHPLALRVDGHGVTLGRSAGLVSHHGWAWRTPQVTVPWEDTDAVVLYRVGTSNGSSMAYVGLRLRAGAALPSGEPSERGFWPRLGRLLGSDEAPCGVAVYRQVFGWRIDEKRLKRHVRQRTRGRVEVLGGL